MTDSTVQNVDQNQTVNTTVNEAQTNTPTPQTIVEGELNPVTKRVVEDSINVVLSEYVSQQKLFNADSLHQIRLKVTELVKKRLGENEISFVDVGLDLNSVANIAFFFRLDIPKDKIKDHIINAKEVVVDNASQASPTADGATSSEQK